MHERQQPPTNRPCAHGYEEGDPHWLLCSSVQPFTSENPPTLRSKLGDKIIQGGPYDVGHYAFLLADELNELRKELMRLRGVPGDPPQN